MADGGLGISRKKEGGATASPFSVVLLLGWLFLIGAVDVVAETGARIRVEPAVDRVPENHLKFYLHFPEPMERGEVFRHIRLVEIDRHGKQVREVPEPFREVELWDETFLRMTLWFHPGRQKPGVNLNVDLGAVLAEGKRYRLEISGDWRTESGEPLGDGFRHDFSTGGFDAEGPDPFEWGTGPGVTARGRMVTIVHTGEALDPESARLRIRIEHDGDGVPFAVDANRIEVAVTATTENPLRIVIDPRLEDLAGNSVSRPFNLDLEKVPDFEERTEPVEIRLPRKIRLPDEFPLPGPSPTGGATAPLRGEGTGAARRESEGGE